MKSDFKIGLLVLLAAAGMALTGCRPRGILSSREMKHVLHDLHQAEAIVQVAGLNYGHDEEVAHYYQLVLNQHGITQAEFDSSLVWYTAHPMFFKTIYPKVLTQLREERDTWEKAHPLAAGQDADEIAAAQPLYSLDELLWTLRHGIAPLYFLPERSFPLPESPLPGPIVSRCSFYE